MRPLRYSINVTLDGCVDHRVGDVDEDLHRHAAENLTWADGFLCGRVTYEMMEAAWRLPTQPSTPTATRPEWMEPFGQAMDGIRKYVVSRTLERVEWNTELVHGDLREAVQKLKQEPGRGILLGGVMLPLALAEMGLIDEYEFVVHPKVVGHGPTLFAGLTRNLDLRLVNRVEFSSGATALLYEPKS